MKRIRTSTGAAVPVSPSAVSKFLTPLAGGGGDAAAGEEVKLSLPSVRLHAAGEDLGLGSLRIGSLRVVWVPSAGAAGGSGSGGYALEYPRIILHALCRDVEAFPEPCLYCQVSAFPVEGEGAGGSGSGGGGGGGGSGGAEQQGSGGGGDEDMGMETCYDVYFTPSDAAALDALFSAMTACAELHPDPAEEGEEEMGGGGFAWAEALMAQAGEEGEGESPPLEAAKGQFEDK